jgi:uncharacterized protein YjiS (DUF1127 family)
MMERNKMFGGLGAMTDWVEKIRQNRRRRASMRALEQVDAATLKDIGMSRAELMSVCFGDANDRRMHHV